MMRFEAALSDLWGFLRAALRRVGDDVKKPVKIYFARLAA